MRILVLLATFAAGVLAGYLFRGEPTKRRAEPERTQSETPPSRLAPRPVAPGPEVPRGKGEIEGQVTAESGQPMAGVLVVATPKRRPILWRTRFGEPDPHDKPVEVYARELELLWESRRHARTDADGRYVVRGLADEAYSVRAFKQDYRFRGGGDHRAGTEVNFVGLRLVRLDVEVLLPRGSSVDRATITGRMQGDDTGLVHRYWHREEPWIVLRPGHYTLSARIGKDYSAEPQRLEVTDGSRVVFRLEGQLRIEGRVLPPPGFDLTGEAVVRALRFEGTPPPPERLKGVARGHGVGGHRANRTYLIADLSPGRYLLGVQPQDREDDMVATAIVEVRDGPVVQDLQIPPPDPDEYILVHAIGPDGPIGRVELSVGYRAKTHGIGRSAWWLRRADKAFLVRHVPWPARYGEPKPDGKWYVRAKAPGLGTPRASYIKGRDRELTIRWARPAYVDVTAANYDGSVLNARLVADTGTTAFDSTNQAEFRGKNTARIGPVQPGRYTLVLGADWRTTVLVKTVALVSGEQQVEVTLPTLYDLTVHLEGAPFSVKLRPLPETQFFRARYENPQAKKKIIFANVPPGRYELEYGTGAEFKKVQITVPAQMEVHLR